MADLERLQLSRPSSVYLLISVRRQRLASGVTRALAALMPGFALYALWVGSPALAGICLGAGVLFFAFDFWLRGDRSYALVLHGLVVVVFGLLLITQVLRPEMAWPWAVILAIIAVPLVGAVHGACWIGASMVLVFAGQWSHRRVEDLVLWILGLIAVGVLTTVFSTLRRRIEEELKAEIEERKDAEQEARAADLAKSEFLANMSHEIRTPLNAVIGFADLLGKEELSSKQHERVDGIHSAADVLLALVDEVLDLAKIEAGKLTLVDRDFSPRDLVDDVLRMLEPRAFEKGLDLKAHMDKRVPYALRGDLSRLRQVLVNLVGNAIKFTKDGRVEVRVESTGWEKERHWLLWHVVDTGIGMTTETQNRIFSPFNQADSSAGREFGGTGLGLAISRHLVEAMGGEIGFSSTYGEGSEFWFRLPFQSAFHDIASSTVTESGPLDWHGARLLVVEDNPVNSLVLVEQLRVLGFEPDVAEDGYIALDLFAKERHNVILMDCQMPGIDGYETTRRLRRLEVEDPRETTPRAVVIAVTAHALSDEREKCLTAGMDDYMSKPFRGNELKALLERWLLRGSEEIEAGP